MPLLPIPVRPFQRGDIPALRSLMSALAEFEGYAASFCVTPDDLAIHGLGDEPRFRAFVADGKTGELLGMAVFYVVPWTYDVKPTLVLKEMFVVEHARGQRIGQALFAAVFAEGQRIGASRLNWTVLSDNTAAQRFYRQQGGRHDSKWQPWTIDLTQSVVSGDVRDR